MSNKACNIVAHWPILLNLIEPEAKIIPIPNIPKLEIKEKTKVNNKAFNSSTTVNIEKMRLQSL